MQRAEQRIDNISAAILYNTNFQKSKIVYELEYVRVILNGGYFMVHVHFKYCMYK